MDYSVFYLKNYGRVVLTVRAMMEKKGFTRNKLAKATGLAYNSINRYFQGDVLSSIDLDILAKICFVLDCDITDVLRYEKPDGR
ncbi:MAG: helix-turn-helix transcriptional regulator [Clostridia bacterium]|nr:helix-turn-helix transcriptional regulator [Clostridia bacterium]